MTDKLVLAMLAMATILSVALIALRLIMGDDNRAARLPEVVLSLLVGIVVMHATGWWQP